jgi:hypothetical protein
MQGSKAEFEMREIRVKMARMEAEKKAATELNENLEDRLRELEEGVGLDISGGATLAGELEGEDSSSNGSAPQQLYHIYFLIVTGVERFLLWRGNWINTGPDLMLDRELIC